MKKLFIILLFSISSLYAGQVSQYANGLIGLWHFNEGIGSTTSDSSTSKNTGTLAGGLDATGWVSGKYGFGLDFDGMGNYIGLNTTITAETDMTYSAWVKYNDQTGAVLAYSSPYTNSIFFFYKPFSRLYVGEGVTFPPLQVYWTFTPSDFINKWVLLTLTKTGTSLEMYYNGVSQGVQTLSGVASVSWIGTDGLGTGNYFYGIIDEVAIYNRALTISEIRANYSIGRNNYVVD